MVATVLSREQVLDWLAEVADPEIPVLSIIDLGIVRDVLVEEGVTVSLSPTYSGCPATEVIEQSVVDALHHQGIDNVRSNRVLSPPWTTDWISAEGRDKLREYGIAPPVTVRRHLESAHSETPKDVPGAAVTIVARAAA